MHSIIRSSSPLQGIKVMITSTLLVVGTLKLQNGCRDKPIVSSNLNTYTGFVLMENYERRIKLPAFLKYP